MNKKILIIATITLIIDQLFKVIISSNMIINESIKVIKKFFYITYVTNTGAAWSILSNKTYLLVIIGLIAIFIIVRYMNTFKTNTRNTIAFGVLLGGIAGNLLDRIFFGYVRDFLDFRIFGYNYPVFNVSDMAIFCSIVLLIIAILKGEDNGINSKRKSKSHR